MSGEDSVGIGQRHTVRSLKDLNDSLVLIILDNTAETLFFSVYGEFNDLIIRCPADALEDDQRAIDPAETKIFN